MPVSPARGVRLRLLGTIAAVVLIATAILAVLARSALVLLDALGAGVSTPTPVAVAALVLAAIVLVTAQARYGYRRVLERVDARTPSEGECRDLSVRVTRLALAADVPAPDVAVVESEEPNSFTVGNGSDAVVVVTRGLLEALDDDELDAVLAHEIAHVGNRDATVATIVATLAAISDALFARERRLADWLRFLATIGRWGGLAILLAVGPAIAVLVAFFVVSGLARIVLAINGLCLGLHAQAREYAADRAAAELTGNPAALASALRTLDGGPPRVDARLHASATLGIVPRPFLDAASEAAAAESSIAEWLPDDDALGGMTVLGKDSFASQLFGRIGRAMEWRPATHPPTAERIDRLLAMAGEER